MFVESASARAQKIRKSIEKNSKVESTPTTVLLIIIDSVSREHFYRSLKKTVQFFNNSIATGEFSNDYNIYDFQINNAHGEFTVMNMIPLLFGVSLDEHQAKLAKLDINRKADYPKFQDLHKNSLWKHFENMGFVTMFGYETTHDFMPKKLGRIIETDHVATNFWHGAESILHYDEYSTKSKCIGNKNSHVFMLDYIRQFVENYTGHHRFSYTHFLTSHESSGSLINSADQDLVDFFRNVLKLAKEKKEDLAIIIAGDHGLKNGPWDKYEEGKQEVLLPFSFLISSKSLIDKTSPNAHLNLQTNSKRLVNKYDWHLTLKQLAIAPYPNYDESGSLYKT